MNEKIMKVLYKYDAHFLLLIAFFTMLLSAQGNPLFARIVGWVSNADVSFASTLANYRGKDTTYYFSLGDGELYTYFILAFLAVISSLFYCAFYILLFVYKYVFESKDINFHSLRLFGGLVFFLVALKLDKSYLILNIITLNYFGVY
ncbi:hypothetical protein [Marinicellulosiphila megalodicopiae]|uniref:hypothetical protein n=1 Tax=Marinicellulosiphila megalodicopiae TaxID=2724896 RepID=UPI003BB0F501